ncbi:MAG: transposase [gamma proteobacterium symbiont of Lucinoma myriamae]|nr:transposase [gamma proteobacterium symbiont of Lucinoma myriamae]
MPKQKVLSKESLAIASNVLEFCREEASNNQLKVPLRHPLERASQMTKLSKSTLQKSEASSSSVTIEKVRKIHKNKIQMDDFDKCVLRRTINEMLGHKKIFPTISLIQKELVEKINFTGSKKVLRRLVTETGFVWKKCESNRKLLMERSDVVALRIRYLRTISQYRQAGREIVYMDETYIHSNHGVSKCWQSADGSKGRFVPFSKGERLIVVHAGSRKGFIPNALLMFKAHSDSGDYHQEMNSENFEKWLREKLIPNLPEKCVIVMDNASYHSIQVDKCPVQSTRKADIQNWLTRHNIAFNHTMLKPELLHLCKINKPTPKFRCDNLLREHGHDVIRLPPYHADLNAIELIWGIVKNDVAKKNVGCKMAEVKKLAEEKFSEVGEKEWANCFSHVEDIERDYWKTDLAVENEVENIVISLSSDESDSDSSETDSEISVDSDDTISYDVASYENIDTSDAN